MSQSPAWKAIAQGPTRQSALDITFEIAQRLRDPERTMEITRRARFGREQSTGEPYQQSWMPFSVVDGHAALALFFGHLDRCFTGQGWDQVAHAYIVPAARSLETAPGSNIFPGLYGGLAGLCFATHYLSRNGTRYERLLETLDALLFQQTVEWIKPLTPFSGARARDYDVITGTAGVGAYLLERLNRQGVDLPLKSVLTQLLYFSERQDGKLRFFIPREYQAAQVRQEQNPQGCIDCGLAHGVPGPLAFLALACLQGVEWLGLKETIRDLAYWVVAQQFNDEWGVNWPYMVSGDTTKSETTSRSRAGWCYGSPGVARAVWLAGCALQDPDLQWISIEAMRAVWNRPIKARGLASPILCHGVAGLLQIVLRFANDSEQSFLLEMASDLTRELLGLFEQDAVVGFRDLLRDGDKVDDIGTLEGAAGVVLTLLAAVTDVEPSWDRMFLLA